MSQVLINSRIASGSASGPGGGELPSSLEQDAPSKKSVASVRRSTSIASEDTRLRGIGEPSSSGQARAARGRLGFVSEIFIDISRPPFCIIRHPTDFTPDDFQQLFASLREKLAKDREYAVVVDLRLTSPSMGGSENREAASAAILENVDFLKDITICEARLVSGPMVRGILTVLDWITPRPWPVRNFGNATVAENWSRSRLDVAGIELPVERVLDGDSRAPS